MQRFILCHGKHAFTRDKIIIMSTPPTPQSNVKFRRNSEKNKRQKEPQMKICQKKGKTSYHPTGNPHKKLIIRELGAGKMTKIDLTGSYPSYRENILPELKHLTGDNIIIIS